MYFNLVKSYLLFDLIIAVIRSLMNSFWMMRYKSTLAFIVSVTKKIKNKKINFIFSNYRMYNSIFECGGGWRSFWT